MAIEGTTNEKQTSPPSWREWSNRNRGLRKLLAIEWALEWAAHWLERMAIFKVLGFLSQLAIIVGAVNWLSGAEERKRTAENDNLGIQTEAWTLIRGQDTTTPDSGRTLALELLASRCQLPANLTLPGAVLNDIHLHGGVLIGAVLKNAKLRHADLSNATLDGVKLGDAVLSYATFSHASLKNADLHDAILFKADLRGANLRSDTYSPDSGSGWERTNLSEANLEQADLSGANLSGAELYGAHLRGATLNGTNLRGADLTKTEIDRQQLENAEIDAETQLPDGIEMPRQASVPDTEQPTGTPAVGLWARSRMLWPLSVLFPSDDPCTNSR
jgi:uncharacterized protein YjbI with pentapeptide repeats